MWPEMASPDSFYKGLEDTFVGKEEEVNAMLSVKYF